MKQTVLETKTLYMGVYTLTHTNSTNYIVILFFYHSVKSKFWHPLLLCLFIYLFNQPSQGDNVLLPPPSLPATYTPLAPLTFARSMPGPDGRQMPSCLLASSEPLQNDTLPKHCAWMKTLIQLFTHLGTSLFHLSSDSLADANPV